MTYQQSRLSGRTTLILVIAGAVLLLGAGAAAILLVAAGSDAPSSPRVTRAAAPVTPASPSAATGGHTVVFEADSVDHASSLATVVIQAIRPAEYRAAVNRREENVELPFQQTLTFSDPLPDLTFWVLNEGADATMVCRIRVDGKLVRERSDPARGYIQSALCQVPAGTT